MSKAKNKVIGGEYINGRIICAFGQFYIDCPYPSKEHIEIDINNVIDCELITDEHRKSAKSGVSRGLVGGALLGPVGMLAGGISAKNKGIYQVAVKFSNGYKSLLEVDDKIYKALLKVGFGSSKKPEAVSQLINHDSNHLYYASDDEVPSFEDIFAENENQIVSEVKNKASNALDEIRQLKELLDIDAITQEEFDVKKKQLLGL